jgi:hypothetical protein
MCGAALSLAPLWSGCAGLGEPSAVEDEGAGPALEDPEGVPKARRLFNGLPHIPGIAEGVGLATTAGVAPGGPIADYLDGLERDGEGSEGWTVSGNIQVCTLHLGLSIYDPCDNECRESVSACLLALTNIYGTKPTIKMTSQGIAALRGGGLGERLTHEATFFGDLFGYEAYAYMAKPEGTAARSCDARGCAYEVVSDSECDGPRPSVCVHDGREWRFPIAIHLTHTALRRAVRR